MKKSMYPRHKFVYTRIFRHNFDKPALAPLPDVIVAWAFSPHDIAPSEQLNKMTWLSKSLTGFGLLFLAHA